MTTTITATCAFTWTSSISRSASIRWACGRWRNRAMIWSPLDWRIATWLRTRAYRWTFYFRWRWQWRRISSILRLMPVEHVQTLIIGGGQAGLAMSHRLKQRGLKHLVIERHRIAERWRSERWDGLRFQFPNWSVRLPDFPFPHSDPDGFATSREIVDFIGAYADFIAAPIRCGVAVTALRRRDGGSGLIAETSDGSIEADNVVVATGPYQSPVMPALLRDDIN